MGDPSKELSGEFSLMLNNSLAVGAKNYPVTCAPTDPVDSAPWLSPDPSVLAAHPLRHCRCLRLLHFGCMPRSTCLWTARTFL